MTKSGFKATVAEAVVVNVSTVTRQDFSLQIGGVGETVTIQSSDVQVETQTGAIGEVVNGQQVRELPLNGRSFVQLTQLQPGVSPQNSFDSKNKGLFSGVDFSVNGNSAQSNLFLTDGANNNDTGSNRTILLYPSIEAIAEFKMLRNSYGPEYGQAAGAIISLATRAAAVTNFTEAFFTLAGTTAELQGVFRNTIWWSEGQTKKKRLWRLTWRPDHKGSSLFLLFAGIQ